MDPLRSRSALPHTFTEGSAPDARTEKIVSSSLSDSSHAAASLKGRVTLEAKSVIADLGAAKLGTSASADGAILPVTPEDEEQFAELRALGHVKGDTFVPDPDRAKSNKYIELFLNFVTFLVDRAGLSTHQAHKWINYHLMHPPSAGSEMVHAGAAFIVTAADERDLALLRSMGHVEGDRFVPDRDKIVAYRDSLYSWRNHIVAREGCLESTAQQWIEYHMTHPQASATAHAGAGVESASPPKLDTTVALKPPPKGALKRTSDAAGAKKKVVFINEEGNTVRFFRAEEGERSREILIPPPSSSPSTAELISYRPQDIRVSREDREVFKKLSRYGMLIGGRFDVNKSYEVDYDLALEDLLEQKRREYPNLSPESLEKWVEYHVASVLLLAAGDVAVARAGAGSSTASAAISSSLKAPSEDDWGSLTYLMDIQSQGPQAHFEKWLNDQVHFIFEDKRKLEPTLTEETVKRWVNHQLLLAETKLERLDHTETASDKALIQELRKMVTIEEGTLKPRSGQKAACDAACNRLLVEKQKRYPDLSLRDIQQWVVKEIRLARFETLEAMKTEEDTASMVRLFFKSLPCRSDARGYIELGREKSPVMAEAIASILGGKRAMKDMGAHSVSDLSHEDVQSWVFHHIRRLRDHTAYLRSTKTAEDELLLGQLATLGSTALSGTFTPHAGKEEETKAIFARLLAEKNRAGDRLFVPDDISTWVAIELNDRLGI